MTKKLSISIVSLLVVGAVLAYASITAYASSSLLGGASFGVGNVILVSDTVNPNSGISFDDANGETFSSLSVLQTDFNVTDDNCGAGSPRFVISIDADNNSVSDGNVLVNLGPSPAFNTCTQNTWTNSGNLIGNNDTDRWDFTGLGGVLGGYSNAPASVLNGKILNISIIADGGTDAAASGTNDGEQTVLIDNVNISVSSTFDFEPATAATLIVDNNSPYCPGATYTTIQAAVNAASSGDTVQVCAGTYDEQVVIDGKDITLQGAGDTTIVQPSAPVTLVTLYTYPSGTFWPGTVLAPLVLVKDSASTTVKNLKVDGVNVVSAPVGAARVAGILYGESGGTVDSVSVTEMVVGAYATRSYGIDLSAVGAARAIEVKDSNITDWSRNGIQVQGGSLTANIHDNTLVGPGDVLVGAAVPNGILFIHGAGGNATGNTISALHHSMSGSRSAGILFYDPLMPGVAAENNDVSDTDDGILVGHNANDVIIRNNNLHDNLEVGIHLEDGATNSVVTGNTITGNTMAGIRFAGAADPGGPSLADTPPGAGNVANRNNISGNIAGVVNYDSTPQTFDATCNWWGNANGPSGSGPGTGDSVSTNVDFSTWLTTSDLSGPCNGPLPQVTVTIVKYIDGVHADATSANSSSFQMLETWTATNFSGTDVPFTLSPVGLNIATPYEAKTQPPFDSGANITMHEVTDGAVVGASCTDGKPFALVGYSSGDTLAEAELAGPTPGEPNLTGMITDKVIIVWNEKCTAPPVVLPPPANACDTPSVAPSGYTLLNGTTGSDVLTIAPFTMFVGLGGYDQVKGPADGNYIICTGGLTDKITLGNGDFTIDAGNGHNSITVGNGNGVIKTGSGNDYIKTGSGVQSMTAGNGYNSITTGNGDKNITTGSDSDQIVTGSGNDVINAGAGYNNVKSGAGSDTVTTGADNDYIDGGIGADTCNAGGGINNVLNCP